jgi:copper chaperone CopZ
MKTITLQIIDMDCVNCAVTIDGDLEDMDGVIKSQTKYAKAQTIVTYDPKKITQKALIDRIEESGYSAKPLVVN